MVWTCINCILEIESKTIYCNLHDSGKTVLNLYNNEHAVLIPFMLPIYWKTISFQPDQSKAHQLFLYYRRCSHLHPYTTRTRLPAQNMRHYSVALQYQYHFCDVLIWYRETICVCAFFSIRRYLLCVIWALLLCFAIFIFSFIFLYTIFNTININDITLFRDT